MRVKLTNTLKWNLVGQVFEAGQKCGKCDFNKTWTEQHDYGFTKCTENLRMCTLIDSTGGVPEDCPGLRAEIQEMENDQRTRQGVP